MILGAMRAGLVPFPISPRTHLPGIAHLLKSTQTSLVVAGGSQTIDATISQLSDNLAEINFSVQFVELPSLGRVLPELGNTEQESEHKPFPPLKAISGDGIINILHSSGSTGMPRSVKFHLEGVFKNIITQPLGWITLCPESHPCVPTSNLTIEAAAATKCLHMVCVPAFLEMWSQEEAAVAYLRQMKSVVFGGGPLAEAIGNKLVDQGRSLIYFTLDWSNNPESGVHIHSCYGATEFGGINEVSDMDDLSDWSYVKFSSHVDTRFIPQHDEDNSFELVFVVSDDHKPFELNSEIDGKPAYRTKDLVVRHPFKPDLWKFVGRLDDQIILLNGEKTNPGPMDVTYSFSPRETDNHSRRPCTSPSTHTQGYHPSLGCLKLYASDIEEMYLDLEKDSSTTDGIQPPQSWDSTEDIEAWISRGVQNLLGREVNSHSYNALRMLKSTLHASSDSKVQFAATKINQQTIFGKPTVRQLAQLVFQLAKNGDTTVDPVVEALQSIRAMIEKYDAEWPRQEAREIQPVKKERVVVTGTTGGLGSHLLAQLLENDVVEKVWAMNRKSSKGNREREVASFEDKLLDLNLLKSEKLVFVDTDLEDPKLGLSDETYDEIRREATVIIHNAWQVNFNLSLQSFEPSIRGARNLLDLAFHSTAPSGLPRFAFASSISVAGFAGPGRQLSEVSVTPEMAATSIGYGQSKLVTEKLLESARNSGLQTCTVRLGQLTGDARSGAWTTTDWVPSLIGSSVDKELPPVIHTSHPRPVPWVDIMNAFSASLVPRTNSQLPVVRFGEWNKLVIEAAASFKGSEGDRYKRFPSTKIQSTVDGMVLADDELRSREEVEM
ncbi:L-aminoadipate-semialdehyde dehydrogenase [Rhizoctonia solani]|uniref:L-aminoadipate-semialdehyde dehydrogenase n=1 Tax=Rhizoctonia solani TaxID=456999 RepID=A0A8H8P8W8_9AGAM|nr:L-aminoadipate-semialdehyde dehydrogenase [Rhizoctonia solani]QRW26760.1 L-aminoadipate-semialdehyde dehydrogenase [Rhizoctonia solani]